MSPIGPSRRAYLLGAIAIAAAVLALAGGGAQAATTLQVVFVNNNYDTFAVDYNGIAYGTPSNVVNEFWRSSDEGRTWTQLAVFPSNYHVWEITPLHSGAILAGIDNGSYGIWRSGDGGSTWSKVLTMPTTPCEYQTLTPHNITEGNGYVFIGTYNNCPDGANTNYVYRSSDDGRTWTTIYTSTTHRHDHGLQYDPITNALYALYGDSKGGIDKSTDNGVSFQSICSTYDDCVGIDIAFGNGVGFYGTDVPFQQNYLERINLTTGQTTRVQALPRVSYAAYALSSSQYLIGQTHEQGAAAGDGYVRLYASTDGGQSFTDVYDTAFSSNGPNYMRVQFSYPNGDFPIQGDSGTVVAHLSSGAPSAPSNVTLPAITGSTQQGQTLSATSGTWMGSPTSFAYRWRDCDSSGNNCADISGATSSTYLLKSSDVGHTVRVVVTATNASGSTPATSTASALVTAIATTWSVSSSITNGQNLSGNVTWTATVSGISTDQITAVDFYVDGVDDYTDTTSPYVFNGSGGTLATTTLTNGSHAFMVVATAADSTTSTVQATATVSNAGTPPTNTALPAITGTAQQGHGLSASTGTWNGVPTSFAYQWRDCDANGNSCTNIAGATSSTYLVVSSDVGHTVRVVVTATNTTGSTPATSAQTAAVTASTGSWSVASSIVSGQTLSGGVSWTATVSGITTSQVSAVDYWIDGVLNWTEHLSPYVFDGDGATLPTTTLSNGSHTLSVVATATDGTTATAQSIATVSNGSVAPANTASPAISGTAQQGQTLTASTGAWAGSPTSFAYRWRDCDANGNNCADISGATTSGYVPQAGDVGLTLRVVVTATNAGGSSSATSAQTAVVGVAGPSNTALPAISGTAQQGQTLTASTGTWSGNPTSYAYKWRDCDSAGSNCSDIAGATTATYVLQAADVGSTLRVVVTATNGGGSTSATSPQTLVATPLPPSNTVLPTASGTAQQGQTLSASTGTWTGSPTSFAYKWRDCDASGSGCADIASATSSSYTVQAADIGHTVRVVVTATNPGGSTSATSSQTGVVVGLAPSDTTLPAITGTARQGQTLTASTGTWTGGPTAFAYTWRDCDPSGSACADIAGAASSSYALQPSDLGATVRVVVTATNAFGSTDAVSAATAVVVPPPVPPANTVLPTISGTARQGETLTASTGTWSGSSPSFSYAWRMCDVLGTSCFDIPGATTASYVVRHADVGGTLRVVVTATNAAGSSPATSDQTAVVVLPLPPSNTALPAIAGTAQEGQTLTASTGTWTGQPSSFAYRWQACDTGGSSCADISGATASTYVVKTADVGSTLHVIVTATNDGGSTDATSLFTSTVVSLPPANTGLPAITGTPQRGQTLTASTGTWTGSPTAFAYKWRDCNASGSNCVDIAGATSATYVAQAADVGSTLRVVVTATNGGGSTPSVSQQTGVVAPQPPSNSALPTISGAAQQGQMLAASNGSWTESPSSYAYRWRDCDAAGNNCADISGATGAAYVLTSADVGATLRVVVTATNSAGSTAATSAQTGVVAALPAPTNSVPPAISGVAQQGQTLTATTGTWTGSPTSFAYQWRDCDTSGANCVNVAGATGSTYAVAAADVGQTLRVVVAATNAGGSTPATSAQTGVVTAQPPANTALPTISGTPQQGLTLTASQGAWTGSPTSFSYSWRRCDATGASCADIGGATSSTYVVQSADIGGTLRVVVTATNAFGSTPATSNQTNAVAGPPPANTALPAIGGTAGQGQTLTTTNGAWTGSPTSFTYAWRSCDTSGASCIDIAGATSQSYVAQAADVGHTIRVVVTATNANGPTPATSAQTATVASAAWAVASSIVAGQTLSGQVSWTATVSGITNSQVSAIDFYIDGTLKWTEHLAPFVFNGDGATLATTTLSNGSHTFKVVATATDSSTSTVQAVATVSNGGGGSAPANTALPTITGTAQQGQSLAASTGTWTGSPTSFSYQWRDCDPTGANCANISGATSSTYTLVAADVGKTVRVIVTATNGSGSTPATSAQTAAVTAASGSAPTNTALPAITGTVQQGQTLTASNGTWTGSPTSFSYQWRDCDASGANCTNVGGATSSTYVLVAADVGHTVRAVVTATNGSGSTAATSAQTGTVTAPTAWTVSSSIAAGATLKGQVSWTATVSGITTGQIASVDFYIDGVLKWTEHLAPFVFNGDGATLSTTALSNGSHTFKVVATASDGTSATTQAAATVSN